MSINYGKLQELILEHGADSARVSEMCDILGTTVEKAQERIEKSADKIARDKRRAVQTALCDSLKGKLQEQVKVGDKIMTAADYAVIAHELRQKARELTAKAKPITLALEAFRQGVMDELVAQGKAEQGVAFSFRVATDKEGNTLVTWKPKGMRSGGGQPNGKVIVALDGSIMSGMAVYAEVVGKVYAGRNTPLKALVSAAPTDYDWSQITYAEGLGAQSVRDDLARMGAIAVEGLSSE